MASLTRDADRALARHALVTLCVASFALGLFFGSTLERSAAAGPAGSVLSPAREGRAPDPIPSLAKAEALAAGPDEVPASVLDEGNDAAGEAGRRASDAVAARTQVASGSAEIERTIRAAALEFGVDQEALLRVAVCESQLDPLAIGPADELGTFQFRARTFRANARTLGYTVADILDVRAQARVAAEMWSRDQQWQWTCAK
ncbi:MAG: transglycosylase SLT domain-containing protein [Chloroflexi bacterium]|nr:transglycosylase SLT domain-containing protein [Chloroflexota bacterium]